MSNKKQRQLTLAMQAFYENPVARVSLELFLTVVAILFFAIFAIKPTLLTMADLVKEIEDKKELDQKLSQKMAALSSAQLEYQIVENKIELIEQAMPSSLDVINLLKIIEKICSEELVVINSLSLQTIPSQEKNINQDYQSPDFSKLEKSSLPIRMNVTGSYQGIRNVVEKLRNNRKLILVDSIAFSVFDNRGEKTLQANLALSVPYYDFNAKNKTKESAVIKELDL